MWIQPLTLSFNARHWWASHLSWFNMKISLRIAALSSVLSLLGSAQAAENVHPGNPPVHCASMIGCAPFQPQYLYAKILGSCPPSQENFRYECGPELPPINVQCLPSAFEVMNCEFDPEGVNVPISHTWQIDSGNATIGQAGRVRCNAGELVAISVFVTSPFDSAVGYTYATCPAYAY